MTQINETTWKAEKGLTFKRKSDDFIMGNCIQLGKNNLTGEADVIENYEEVDDPEYVAEDKEKIQQAIHKVDKQ